jgi:hypothetical protein
MAWSRQCANVPYGTGNKRGLERKDVDTPMTTSKKIRESTGGAYPHVEDVLLVKFTRAHADGVMVKLPGVLRRSTRRQVAQVLHRVLRLAVFTGELEHSPLPSGWLPKVPKADSIAKESLLPSEETSYSRGALAYRVVYLFHAP